MEINNLLSNPNVKVVEQVGGIRVIEYQKDFGISLESAAARYFASEMDIKRRQVLISLNNDSYTISSGAMQWTAGNVTMVADVNGVGDLFSKALKATVTNESAIKPKYQGTGILMLEPTYKHILIEDLNNWGGNMIIQDGMFLAMDANVEQKVVMRSNFSSAALGNEGLFNLSLKGNGKVVLESPTPRTELIELVLNNETVRIDGSYAIAWSGSLEFTVEKSSKSLLGSAVSGEGLVNVYRGTGKILMSAL